MEQQRRTHRIQRTTLGLYSVAALTGAQYAAYLLDLRHAGQAFAYVTLVLASMTVFAKVGVELLTILSGSPSQQCAHSLEGDTDVDVDVLITVCGESPDMARATALAVRDMTGRHRTCICDDGRSDEIRAVADSLGIFYLRRPSREGAKAGNVNHALANWAAAPFVAIFDADHAPFPHFLTATVHKFADPAVAFVQTPQSYSNIEASAVARAAHDTQLEFYRNIAPAKNELGAMFCVGTNVVYRRAALDDIGGMYAESKSEDIWTSFKLHCRGWKSAYVAEVLAEGHAPERVTDFMVQQKRWSRGAFEVLVKGRPWSAEGLTLDQRVQYLQPGLHYLHSAAIVYFALLPASFILFGFRPMNVSAWSWLAHYLPFWLALRAAGWVEVGRPRIWSYLLSLASAPTHLRSLGSTLLDSNDAWTATNAAAKRNSIAVIVDTALPQTLLALTLAAATFVGLFPLRGIGDVAVAVVLCASLGAALIAALSRVAAESFVAARSARRARRTAAAAHDRTPNPITSRTVRSM